MVTDGSNGKDNERKCPSGWLLSMLVDVGEGGIQSIVQSRCSSSMDGGGIHTGKAGMTENDDI